MTPAKKSHPQPAAAPAKNRYWLGVCDTPNGTAFVLEKSEITARTKLYRAWRGAVYPGFPQEKHILTFADLTEWNGAQVKRVRLGQSGIWDRL